ncbi:hypothetical protein S245_046629, partial [Arachis hypogaea]
HTGDPKLSHRHPGVVDPLASAEVADPHAFAGADAPGLYSSTTSNTHCGWMKPLSHDAPLDVCSEARPCIPWAISIDTPCASADLIGEGIVVRSGQPPKSALVQC